MSKNQESPELVKVLELLTSEETSLLELARASGRDPFEFYRGADLSNLDLAEQDLRGLNFERATLIGSDLESVLFDPGAFNGSHLDERYGDYEDPYIFYLEDLRHPLLKRLYVFAEFRKGAVDEIISAVGLSYGEAAQGAAISPATLRKARRSEIVSAETARSIAAFVDDLVNHEAGYLHPEWTGIRQPLAKIIAPDPTGFREISRAELVMFFEMAEEILILRKDKYPKNPYLDHWRDSPHMLNFYIRFYHLTGSVHVPDQMPDEKDLFSQP